MHSKKSKQANDIILEENGSAITSKAQIVELFNDHFIHIADGVAEIGEQDYGEGFRNHPSIKAIHANNATNQKLIVSAFSSQIKHKLLNSFQM